MKITIKDVRQALQYEVDRDPISLVERIVGVGKTRKLVEDQEVDFDASWKVHQVLRKVLNINANNFYSRGWYAPKYDAKAILENQSKLTTLNIKANKRDLAYMERMERHLTDIQKVAVQPNEEIRKIIADIRKFKDTDARYLNRDMLEKTTEAIKIKIKELQIPYRSNPKDVVRQATLLDLNHLMFNSDVWYDSEGNEYKIDEHMDWHAFLAGTYTNVLKKQGHHFKGSEALPFWDSYMKRVSKNLKIMGLKLDKNKLNKSKLKGSMEVWWQRRRMNIF